jgi:hypothetical protein
MTNSQKRQIVRQSAESLLDRIHEARQVAAPLSGRQQSALKPVVQAVGRLTRTYRGAARHSLSAYSLRLSKLQARARFILKGFTSGAEAECSEDTEAEAPEPANAGRYADASATVVVNPQGLPVALQQTEKRGEPCKTAFQVVTPDGVVDQPAGAWDRLMDECAPLN